MCNLTQRDEKLAWLLWAAKLENLAFSTQHFLYLDVTFYIYAIGKESLATGNSDNLPGCGCELQLFFFFLVEGWGVWLVLGFSHPHNLPAGYDSGEQSVSSTTCIFSRRSHHKINLTFQMWWFVMLEIPLRSKTNVSITRVITNTLWFIRIGFEACRHKLHLRNVSWDSFDEILLAQFRVQMQHIVFQAP